LYKIEGCLTQWGANMKYLDDNLNMLETSFEWLAHGIPSLSSTSRYARKGIIHIPKREELSIPSAPHPDTQ